MGTHIPVDVHIENTYRATIDFTLFKSPYTFTIERWARRGLAGFLTQFHELAQRDIPTYGRRIEDADGFVSIYEDNAEMLMGPLWCNDLTRRPSLRDKNLV
eukprot:gene29729-38870_t